MSVDNAKRVLDVAGLGLEALEVIGGLINQFAHSSGPTDTPETGLGLALGSIGAIEHIVNSVHQVLNGKVSTEDLEKHLAKLRADLTQNDTAIDAAIDAKPER